MPMLRYNFFLSSFFASFLVTFQQEKYTGTSCVFFLSYLLKWFLENDVDTQWMHFEKDKGCIYCLGNFFAL